MPELTTSRSRPRDTRPEGQRRPTRAPVRSVAAVTPEPIAGAGLAISSEAGSRSEVDARRDLSQNHRRCRSGARKCAAGSRTRDQRRRHRSRRWRRWRHNPRPRHGFHLTVSLASRRDRPNSRTASRTELDRLTKNISDRGLRQVELTSFAGNGEPDSRKVSLARALVVRTYLIDKGVKSRIEIGTLSSSDGNERVEIVVPNT